MQKCFIDMEKRFSKATLALLFLSVLILTIIVTPVAKADDPTITFAPPAQGPAGEMVMVYITGYPGGSTVSITFGTTFVGSGSANDGGNVNAIITIPSLPPGAYTVTATGSTGDATTTYTITGAAPTPTPIGTPTGTPIGLSPTNSPVPVGTGFWSPLMIAIISIVIAFAIFITVVYAKRGRQKTSPYKETTLHELKPSTPPKKPTASSNINQPYQPYQSSKINQPANNSQQLPFTKICRHCKRTIRDDLNVCPYCSKRLR